MNRPVSAATSPDDSKSKGGDLSEHFNRSVRQRTARPIPRLIQLAEHAVLDRLDLTFVRKKEILQAGELAALRNAHRALKVLEKLYVSEKEKLVA